MRILISSYPFYPSIGGIEVVTELLAEEFVEHGHAVKIATMTPSTEPNRLPFDVIRQPTARTLIAALRWCDVYLQNQISLQFAWPLLFIRRPWVVAQLHPLGNAGGASGLKQRIKRAVIGLSRRVIACSHAIARQLGRDGITVIPNPYRDREFRLLPDQPRQHDLVFLGRLVSDKGLATLLEALALIKKDGMTPSLVIVGDGPERQSLQSQCTTLELTASVRFLGTMPTSVVVDVLNRSRVMVVPSIAEEGFGIVALEGIACGCVVVAAEAGGLAEAVGPCGVTFPKGNIDALARRLKELFSDKSKLAALRTHAPEHLNRHRPRTVAENYLAILDQVSTTTR
jgi:glycogen(starch) synthase